MKTDVKFVLVLRTCFHIVVGDMEILSSLELHHKFHSSSSSRSYRLASK